MSLLKLVPKERRPHALLITSLELACEAALIAKNSIELSADEYREMLSSLLDDCVEEGIIRSWKRTLDRFEITHIGDDE